MPFDFLGDAASIGDTASAFNAAELTGLDSFDAAFEAGITDANSFDFAQGPDGLLGSAIPGAGGDLGVEGWYNVDYDQTFIGSDSQAALFDGGASVDSDIYNGSTFEGGAGLDNPAAVDSNFVSDAGARDELVNADAAASVDSNTDLTTRGIRVADVGPLNVAPEPVFNPRDGTLATPLPTVGADPVDRLLTGASTGLNTGLNAVKAAGANAVSGLASSIQAEIPKIVAQAKQQVIGQAVGAATGLVKATVAKALPGPLAAVANNVVNSVGNNAAIALGATPVSGAVDLTGGGGGDTANLSPGQVAALGGGGGEITAAGLIDTAATNIRNYGNQLYSDTARGVQSLVANSVSSVTATGQNAEAVGIATTDARSAALTPEGIAAAQASDYAAEEYSRRLLAQRQEVLAAQRKISDNGDWRVRLTLAPGSDYLYNDPTLQADGTNGILWPLKQSGGVIFPYTPKISTSYNAEYTPTSLTHSNYKNYFYQGSNVGEIGITAKFTAQDTMEAQYLLAVIHFFRSVTKMFYGQDAQRGAPPPLVYLTGFGQFQFQNHPCVVSKFGYELPENVDYIRARSVNVNGMDLLTRRDRPMAVPGDPISGAYKRLADLFSGQGISKGAQSNSSPTGLPSPPSLGQYNPTYVPTSIDISLTLLPVMSRSQVSQQFSLKKFANGQLIAGGFW